MRLQIVYLCDSDLVKWEESCQTVYDTESLVVLWLCTHNTSFAVLMVSFFAALYSLITAPSNFFAAPYSLPIFHCPFFTALLHCTLWFKYDNEPISENAKKGSNRRTESWREWVKCAGFWKLFKLFNSIFVPSLKWVIFNIIYCKLLYFNYILKRSCRPV